MKNTRTQGVSSLVGHGFPKNRAVRMQFSEMLYEFKHRHRKHDEMILKAPLSRSNYREKFHQLLYREEDEHQKILTERYYIYIYLLLWKLHQHCAGTFSNIHDCYRQRSDTINHEIFIIKIFS